jgi:hypothetical protein
MVMNICYSCAIVGQNFQALIKQLKPFLYVHNILPEDKEKAILHDRYLFVRGVLQIYYILEAADFTFDIRFRSILKFSILRMAH